MISVFLLLNREGHGKISVFAVKMALATLCGGKIMDKLRCKLFFVASLHIPYLLNVLSRTPAHFFSSSCLNSLKCILCWSLDSVIGIFYILEKILTKTIFDYRLSFLITCWVPSGLFMILMWNAYSLCCANFQWVHHFKCIRTRLVSHALEVF